MANNSKKTREGVMVMYQGKAWGVSYNDGNQKCYGWVDPIGGIISDPKYCKKTTDLTYRGSIDEKILAKGEFVRVRRVTTVELTLLD